MATSEPERLSAEAKAAILAGPAYLSVVSYWEVMIKSMKGLLEVGDLRLWFDETIETLSLQRPQLSDAGDEMVLETAVIGQADAIVTFNHSDYKDAPRRFGIRLLKPAEALREIRK